MSGIRALVSRGYGNSVVRRSFVLLCLMGPAFAINLVLYYIAATLLPAKSFGVFYIAVTAGNVLYSGSTVLNIFFTRYLVLIIQAAGIPPPTRHGEISFTQLPLGALRFLHPSSCWLALANGSASKSWSIIVLIVLDAFTAYLIDVDRALLQSLRKTVYLGSVTLAWMALRFLFGIAGIALFKTAWAGLLGAVLAAIAHAYSLVYCLLVTRPRRFATGSGIAATAGAPASHFRLWELDRRVQIWMCF